MSPTATPDAIEQPQFVGQMVPINLLFPSPLNPRKKFTDASLADLTSNIQKVGRVIVPLVLRPQGKRFEIIDGERRFRASTAAGNITQLPAIVLDDLADGDAIEMMLLTSIQKQELTPLEEAGGFRALLDSSKSKYSAAYIAERIGRSEKYVWDRMKLLDLIPILKKLLDADRILVGHGELLAKLKPEDQERAIDWTHNSRTGREGLWQNENNLLEFDEDEDRNPTAKNFYKGLKPVTVKELESWIAHHVRFDAQHMATSAPLEFGEVAKQIEEAMAKPGRGRKVISITNEYRVADDAKDPSERTYGSQAWVRADGKEKSRTCDYSVLGAFVAGPGYGTALEVCINRDKCQVHFAQAIKDREKNQKLRQQGKGGQAAQREQKEREVAEQKRVAEEAARKRIDALRPEAEAAVRAHIEKLPFKKLFTIVAALYAKGAKNPEQLVRSIAVGAALDSKHYMPYFESNTKKFGFDLKAWFADQQKQSTAKAAPAKPAKKAKKR